MIIWGSGGGSEDLGQMELKHCSTCEKERPFKLLLNYRYSHLYYLRWVTEKKYHMACDICRRGWELDTAKVESKLEKNPIPFMTRYGWTFLVGLILLVILSSSFQKK
ncbi:hypothetical protein ACO0LF_07395 [Undibacterium sp. Di27W]|uniref:hypothetical protein n=1 Tax=Undibacterium sp. Di27W TaxID=3413036 RepID=UPI003BF1D580